LRGFLAIHENAKATSSMAALQTKSPLLAATAGGNAAAVISPKQHHVVAAHTATRTVHLQSLIMGHSVRVEETVLVRHPAECDGCHEMVDRILMNK
jgi:hypothetical protein